MIALITLSHFMVTLILIIISNHGGNLIQAHIFIFAGCSQQKYQPNTPYETNLNVVLSSIVTSSSRSLYNAFAAGNDTASVSPDSAAYGLYQCRGDLKPADCETCIAGLINQIELLCPYTDGGNLQLDGCYMRYEHMDFLGKLDTGLRYRKCSAKNGGGDVGFLRRRDDVLADLGAAMGFRVSITGEVEGYAQCLGDLTASDCSACLVEAVNEVKTLCGSAAAGEVFLAQCYVRYWEAGYSDSSSDSSNQDDDVGKTVAIIVGVVAGVSVLIVLLSFCRKALG